MNHFAPLPEFDLFAVPPTQLSVDRDICTEHRPISTISNATSPLQFEIHTGVDEYIQFRETELYIKFKVTIVKVVNGVVTRSGDGATIKGVDWLGISPVNYLLHSMIKQAQISIGNRQISSSSSTYAYRAYIEALLGYGKESKDSFLTGGLWYKDEAGKMDDIHKLRNSFLHVDSNAVELELIGKLHLDLAFQYKALLGGCTVNITLFPNDPFFYLLCDTTKISIDTVQIVDACLYVHRSKVNNAIVNAHNAALKISNAKYFYTRCDVKSFSFGKGALDAQLNNVVNGYLPRRVFVACVSSEAFSGSLNKNPFNFKHYDINYIVCYVDGEQYPQKAYQPDFKNQKYMREFMGLFESTNQNEVHSNIDLNRFDYGNGFTIFGFNFAPDLSEGAGIGGHLSSIKRGSLRVEMRFAASLPETINVLVFCEFDSMLEIDSNRKVVEEL